RLAMLEAVAVRAVVDARAVEVGGAGDVGQLVGEAGRDQQLARTGAAARREAHAERAVAKTPRRLHARLAQLDVRVVREVAAREPAELVGIDAIARKRPNFGVLAPAA